MMKKRRFSLKFISLALVLSLLFQTNLYGVDMPQQKLATPSVFQLEAPDGTFASAWQGMLKDGNMRLILLSIASHFLDDEGSQDKLVTTLAQLFHETETRKFLDACPVNFDLDRDVTGDREKVVIRFGMGDARGRAVIKRKRDNTGSGLRYTIGIAPDETQETGVPTDIKGKDAPESDPIIGEHIRRGRLVEVYIDEETQNLKAARVKWIRGYEPGMVSPEIYRDEEIEIAQIFSPEELDNLYKWMMEHRVRGSPVKFRVVLGDAAIGWNDDIDRANIAHAGVRDHSIYIGSILLKYLMRSGNDRQRKDILDDDEYRHLKGEGHGSEEDLARRIAIVKDEVAEDAGVKRAVSAMVERRPYALKDILLENIRAGNVHGVLDLFLLLNNVYLSFPQYPVEAGYPLKKAVALLDRKEKGALAVILTGPEAESYADNIVIDDILMMIVPSLKETPEETSTGVLDWVNKIRERIRNFWVKRHAAKLQGRSVWQISPEIWYESGGLSRVMQYHGAGMKDILEGSDVRFRQLEPHYMYDRKGNPLDYSKKPFTNPFPDIKPEENGSFTVDMDKGIRVKVEVSRGVNDLGVESFFVRDKGTYDEANNQIHGEGYYTHSIYNYREPVGDDRMHLPTWEEFSMFFSKASLEWVKIKEAEERKKIGKEWKAPLLHTNDSQTALVGVYKKIWLDKELKKKEADESHIIDPVLMDGVVFFTTHTYFNRKVYPVSYGQGVKTMEYFGISGEYGQYREIFRYEGIYDMASGGLRSADGQGCVSWAHRDDIAHMDEWINEPEDAKLVRYYRDIIGTEFDLRAVANADNRRQTMEYFRRYFYSDDMKGRYGEDSLDVDHPTADQVFLTKKAAKAALSLIDPATGKPVEYYTSGEKPEDGKVLRDDQQVFSFSGRFVPEKGGRGQSNFEGGEFTGDNDRGAFSNENMEFLVKRGAQVVIYGNVQQNDPRSVNMAKWLIELTQRLKNVEAEPGYEKGQLIFLPSFTQKQQRALLAATDVQVQDSDPKSEAAGFTESDISACGGIQVGTRRYDNDGIGEGLFQQQGVEMDLAILGHGNMRTPVTLDSAGYRAVFSELMDLYDEDIDNNRLKHYQATSVRLSQILEARPTSAVYLREFSRTIERKERITRKKEAARELKRRRMRVERKGLQEQIFTPDFEDKPGEYTAFRAVRHVIGGEIARAAEIFLTTSGFQGSGSRKHVAAAVFNGLISYSASEKQHIPLSREFLRGILTVSTELFEDEQAARDVQVMAGQALTILRWIEQGSVDGAPLMRLTSEPDFMVRSSKGDSFIDVRTLPGKVSGPLTADASLPGSFNSENMPGFFWRGVEMMKKLGKNIIHALVRNSPRMAAAEKTLVMYLMDHGFLAVPENLREATVSGRMSTLHETFFLHDMIPGTMHTTSTGPGHYQGMDLDIKHVTEGRGFQLNVKYDASGKIVACVVTELDASDPRKNKALALPGYVDYVINLGGLRFNDLRVTLSLDNEGDRDVLRSLRSFIPQEFGNDADAAEFGKNLRAEIQPYIGFIDGSGKARLLAGPEAPSTLVPGFMSISAEDLNGKSGLIEFYGNENLSSEDIESLLKNISEKAVFDDADPVFSGMLTDDETLIPGKDKEYAVPSMGKSRLIEEYVNDNDMFIAAVFGGDTEANRLIRISIDYINRIGKENVRPFLEALNGVPGSYIELFKENSTSEVSASEYIPVLGFPKKEFPEELELSARTRANTVTLLPVDKTDTFRNGGRIRRPGELIDPGWRDLGNMWQSPEKTIISPVGLNFDKAGLIRGLFMGLRLSRIAEDPSLDEDSDFVKFTLAQYRDFCVAMGQDGELFEDERFDLQAGDLITMARWADKKDPAEAQKDLAEALNRIIRLLPILPLNFEEIRRLYEKAGEALIRA
ncbi:MAG: hypothetical protein WCV56_05990 [Candidatus Omnitrophota bacterium]